MAFLLSWNKSEKEYIVEKKKKYTFTDYDNVISEFNKCLVELIEEICSICIEKKWKDLEIEFGTYTTTLEIFIKGNKTLAIRSFANNIYPYYNYIKNRDEQIILKEINKKDAKDNVTLLFKYDKLWSQTGELNKESTSSSLQSGDSTSTSTILALVSSNLSLGVKNPEIS